MTAVGEGFLTLNSVALFVDSVAALAHALRGVRLGLHRVCVIHRHLDRGSVLLESHLSAARSILIALLSRLGPLLFALLLDVEGLLDEKLLSVVDFLASSHYLRLISDC